MRRLTCCIVAFLACLLVGVGGLAKEIHLPDELPEGTSLTGYVKVAIAEWFYKDVGEENPIPRELQIWSGPGGLGDADYFDIRIEAHPGDVIVFAPGLYKPDLWVYTPQLTITTDPDAEEMAQIWGTVQIEADRVILDRIAVTGSRKQLSSGHGIELNREVINWVAIRNCRVQANEWMGIHIVGPRGEISRMVVENCQILENGSFGLEVQSVEHLIVTGCTITGNEEGVHIGSYVLNVEMENNEIYGNRSHNVYHRE